jgi:hypothetical protein
MKRNLNFLSYLIIAVAIVFTSCKSDDPSAEEQQLTDLSATWNITNAAPAGFDAVALSGASITFTGAKEYSVSGLTVLNENNLNNDNSFAAEGTFTLTGDDFNTLTLSGGGTFTIQSLDKGNGNLSLLYSATYPKSTSSDVSIVLTASL